MIVVASHAEPNPTIRIINSHDCFVGSGSLACQRWKAKAAAIEIAHWATSILVMRIGKA